MTGILGVSIARRSQARTTGTTDITGSITDDNATSEETNGDFFP